MTGSRDSRVQMRQIARQRFGFDELTPGQEEAIGALMDDHDTPAILPTGAGKSAIYQITGLMLPGPTVVISPRLGAVIEELGHPRVLALTATAAPVVRTEIVERLGFQSPRVVARGFDRPNIWFGVHRFDDEAVDGHRGPIELSVLKEETGLRQGIVISALTNLEESGAIERLADGAVVEIEMPDHLEAVAAEVVEREEQRRAIEQSRIISMRDCRRQFLLNYLGEAYEGPCGACDNCDAGVQAAVGIEPFPIEACVRHAKWGEGIVIRYEGDNITVLFVTKGYKTLGTELVLDSALLKPASGDAAVGLSCPYDINERLMVLEKRL